MIGHTLANIFTIALGIYNSRREKTKIMRNKDRKVSRGTIVLVIIYSS
jgi:hypothetical protein